MLKFYLVTDTHIYNTEKLGTANRYDQQCVNESAAIIDAAFDMLASKTDSDIVLIAGDLTNNGERASHELMLEKLRKLKSAGKRVIVITATHDYGLRGVDENGNVTDPDPFVASRIELREMYDEFGFNEAIAEHKASMSYVVQLSPGYRLLCLNDDGNGRSFCGYDESELSWILEQIRLAKEQGQFIFAMTHHPVVPPTPVYPLMSERDMLGAYKKTSQILADSGLRFIFTGHTHMQNIGFIETEKGNRLYDINTGSLVGYPVPVRAVTVDDNNMNIVTENIDTFDWDFGGRDMMTYLGDHFDELLNKIFDSMAFDFDEFCSLAGGFSLERKAAEKLKIPIKLTGKLMQKFTLGRAGTLLCCRGKIDKSVRGILLKDLIIECVRNIWSGNEHYSPDTPVGGAVLAITKRLNPIIGSRLKGAGIDDFPAFVMSLIYDETPDTNAVLPLK